MAPNGKLRAIRSGSYQLVENPMHCAARLNWLRAQVSLLDVTVLNALGDGDVTTCIKALSRDTIRARRVSYLQNATLR
jgi:hypothetical protein